MIHGGTVGDKGLSSLGVFYFVDAWMAFGVRPSDACGGGGGGGGCGGIA